MKRRVFIDAPLYRSPTRGGVNRFVAEIASALTLADDFETFVQAPNVSQIEANRVRRRLTFRGRGYLPWLDRMVTRSAVTRWQADLYLNTYYAWQPRLSVPSVCVIYDFIVEKFREQFIGAGRIISRKEQAIRGADRMLCDSEATKRDLLTLYPFVDAHSAEVAHFGVDTAFFRPDAGSDALGCLRDRIGGAPFWLYVGRREFPYKNFAGLVQGFGRSRSASTHKLVVVGGEAEPSPEEQNWLAELRLGDSVLFLGRVSDSVLRAAYSEADALVYPSLYEGFGLPLLEAMACGAVVLSSDSASLPSVGGDVALYFPPDNTEEIAAALDRGASMPLQEREARIRQGLERVKGFTWKRCTDQVVDLLRRLA